MAGGIIFILDTLHFYRFLNYIMLGKIALKLSAHHTITFACPSYLTYSPKQCRTTDEWPRLVLGSRAVYENEYSKKKRHYDHLTSGMYASHSHF